MTEHSLFVADLPDYSKITFPKTSPIPLEQLVPDATLQAVELFKQFILYDSGKRISARDALAHAYFFETPLPAQMEDMPCPEPSRRANASINLKVDISFEEIFADLFALKF